MNALSVFRFSGEFSELVKATVGAEFHTSSAKMDGVEYPIQIWDIAGSYRTHQNVTTQFFRRSDAVMICCNASQVSEKVIQSFTIVKLICGMLFKTH